MRVAQSMLRKKEFGFNFEDKVHRTMLSEELNFYLCKLYHNKSALMAYFKNALTTVFLIPSTDYLHITNNPSLC